MIDIRKLKELVRLMVENDLAELDLRDQQETVTIKRGAQGQPVVYAQPAMAAPAGGYAPAPAAETDGAPDDTGLLAIESPMVGTFYSAPNPDSEPFITVGKSVSADSVVCLVEAMKVFNEIKAEVSGVVESIEVQNSKPVEYGQVLFKVRPG